MQLPSSDIIGKWQVINYKYSSEQLLTDEMLANARALALTTVYTFNGLDNNSIKTGSITNETGVKNFSWTSRGSSLALNEWKVKTYVEFYFIDSSNLKLIYSKKIKGKARPEVQIFSLKKQ